MEMYDLTYTERLKMKNEYGSVAYYQEMFADFIGDIQHDTPDMGDNLVEAFKLAIAEWRDYYAEQVKELDRISTKLND